MSETARPQPPARRARGRPRGPRPAPLGGRRRVARGGWARGAARGTRRGRRHDGLAPCAARRGLRGGPGSRQRRARLRGHGGRGGRRRRHRGAAPARPRRAPARRGRGPAGPRPGGRLVVGRSLAPARRGGHHGHRRQDHDGLPGALHPGPGRPAGRPRQHGRRRHRRPRRRQPGPHDDARGAGPAGPPGRHGRGRRPLRGPRDELARPGPGPRRRGGLRRGGADQPDPRAPRVPRHARRRTPRPSGASSKRSLSVPRTRPRGGPRRAW